VITGSYGAVWTSREYADETTKPVPWYSMDPRGTAGFL